MKYVHPRSSRLAVDRRHASTIPDSDMAKQAVIILTVVLVFGVLVPWFRGWMFLDSATVVVYACLSLLFVAPTAAEVFGTPETMPAPAEILPKAGAILAYGWGVSLLILASGLITVNLAHWEGRIITPPLAMLGSALLLGLTASTATIAASALLAFYLGRSQTKTLLRIVFLLLLLAWRFTGDRNLTESGIEVLNLIASAVCAVAAAILLSVLVRLAAGGIGRA